MQISGDIWTQFLRMPELIPFAASCTEDTDLTLRLVLAGEKVRYDVAAVVAGFALLTHRPTLCELTYFWGLTASVQALLTPSLGAGFPDYRWWWFALAHGGVVVAARHALGNGVRQDVRDIVYVDPETFEALPDGEEGEIWLNGPCITRGYWRQPERTKEVFQAQIKGRDKHYLRTGDRSVLPIL